MMEAGKIMFKFLLFFIILYSCELSFPTYKKLNEKSQLFNEDIRYVATISDVAYKENKTYVLYIIDTEKGKKRIMDSLLLVKNVYKGDRYSSIYSKIKQPDLSPPLRILLWHEPLKNPNKHYKKKEAIIEQVNFFRSGRYQFAEIHYSFILDDKRYTGIALKLIDKSTKSKYKKGNTIEVEYVIDNPENNNIFNNDSE